MKGRARAAEDRFKEAVTTAWHAEFFAREGKRFKPLGKYLTPRKTTAGQSASSMLGVLREINSRGAAMRIRRVA